METDYYATKPNATPNSCDQIKSTVDAQHKHIHHQDVLIETKVEQIVTKHSEPQRAVREADEWAKVPQAPRKSTANLARAEQLDAINLVNRDLNEQLRTVRCQLTDNLSRIREFENRVRLIPKLELQLSVEKAENRDLHLKLKTLESIIEQKEQNEKQLNELAAQSKDASPAATSPFTANAPTKPFSTQRVCAMSLESLNIRFPGGSTPSSTDSPQRSTEQIKTPPATTDASSMTNRIISRDIGVVTIPPQIQSHSIAINTDISERNPFDAVKPSQLSVGVQCEMQPKVRTRHFGTITEREPSPPPKPILHSIGIMAVPDTRDVSCAARPETRSIAINNMHKPARVRSFGTDPIKCLLETTVPSIAVESVATVNVPSISLKLLDTVPSKPAPLPEKPTEVKSIGVQHTPTVSSKFSQCKAIVERLPKVHTQTESTDTHDLMLLIHRGCNTDAAAAKKDRVTNTDCIRTVDEATNTVSAMKHFTDMGTNPHPTVPVATSNVSSSNAPVQNSKHDTSTSTKDDSKCTSCLAKFEIKQRTIIKNPHKINVATVHQSHAPTIHQMTVSETHADDTSTVQQQNDLQSRIPRPTALISPRPDRKFVRQNTYTIPAPASPISTSMPLTPSSPVASVSHVRSARPPPCPAEAYLA